MDTGTLKLFYRFYLGSLKLVVKGGQGYYAWVGFLLLCILVGAISYF